MFVLDRLWRGEISPSERYIRRGSEYETLLKELSRQEEHLRSQLTAEGAEALSACQRLQMELQSIENRETFLEAFRMGAGMILDVLLDHRGDFTISEEE